MGPGDRRGADGLYREGAYVALSRGRAGNHLTLTDPELAAIVADPDPDLDRHDTGLDPDPVTGVDDDLIRRFSASRAKELAHTIDPDVTFVDQLERHLPLAEIEEMVRFSASVEHGADRLVGATVHQLEERLDRTIRTAHHAHVGIAACSDDRHNVGIIIDLDDHTGTVVLRFTSARSRHREHQRRHIDPAADRQQIVDENVRLDPDATHPRHHLRRRRTPRQVPTPRHSSGTPPRVHRQSSRSSRSARSMPSTVKG